jgi:hypothetical protein
MKAKHLGLLLPALLMTLTASADQGAPEVSKEPHFIQYHNRAILFAPFHQGYERIKPRAFYVGVEGYLASGLNKKDDNTLLDAELRMGYNFFLNGRDHLTPVVGVGFVEDFFRKHHRTRHRPGVVYGLTGLLYDHEFNTIFTLGINAKFLGGGPVGNRRFEWGSPVIGSDVSLPITFRFGHKRHWDYRIEPFDIFLHGSKTSQNYFGFRNSLGYRF